MTDTRWFHPSVNRLWGSKVNPLPASTAMASVICTSMMCSPSRISGRSIWSVPSASWIVRSKKRRAVARLRFHLVIRTVRIPALLSPAASWKKQSHPTSSMNRTAGCPFRVDRRARS